MWIPFALAGAAGLLVYWIGYNTNPAVQPRMDLIRNLTLHPPRAEAPRPNQLAADLQRFPLTRTWKAADFYLLQTVCAVAAFGAYVLPGLIGSGLAPDYATALLVSAVALLVPQGLLWFGVRRRYAQLGKAVYDLLSHLVLQLAAHRNTMLAFQTAPRAVREPLRTEIKYLLADLKLRSMQPALEAFAQRTGHPYLHDFAEAVIYQRKLSIDVEQIFKHQEEIFRRNMRARAKTQAKVYEACVAAASIFLFGNLLFMWMVPTLMEMGRAFSF